jgi:CheY-like chemotaxis protein
MPLRILLIDDDAGFRNLFGTLLQRNGYKVLLAGSSEVALASAERADVALVDLRMPGVDGVQLIPMLRSRNPGLRIVACSGSAEEVFKADLERICVEHFLAKPYTFAELAEKLKLVFGPGSDQLPSA